MSDAVDMLSDSYAAWQQGIDLGPATPRIRDLIVSGYREILEAARFLKNEQECARIIRRLEEMGVQP